MTATDPRPQLAAMLAARLAPAAEALAAACAEDANPEPPPSGDRARAEYHRAGRAGLAHLRQLLALLDWSARHLPEPEPADRPSNAPDEPVAAPQPANDDYDGSEDEFHYCGEVYIGSQETPEFRAWLEDVERRFGPVPTGDRRDGRLNEYRFSGRKYVGKLTTPEFRAWCERQKRRNEEALARCLDEYGRGTQRTPGHDPNPLP